MFGRKKLFVFVLGVLFLPSLSFAYDFNIEVVADTTIKCPDSYAFIFDSRKLDPDLGGSSVGGETTCTIAVPFDLSSVPGGTYSLILKRSATGAYATSTPFVWDFVSQEVVMSTTTRFISFVPTLGSLTEVATSTSFEFTITGYLSAADYAEGNVELEWSTAPGLVDSGIFGNILGDDVFVYTIPSAGFFSTTSLRSVLTPGAYTANFRLRRSRVPLLHLYKTYVSATGVFLVGSGSDVSQEDIDNATAHAGINNFYGAEFYGDAENATSTLLGLGKAFSLRESVLGKFPINWVVESAVIVQALKDQTSTTTFQSIVLDFNGLSTIQAIPTTTPTDFRVTLFSPALFDTVAAVPGIQTMRTLVVWSLWIGLIFYAWRRGASMFKTR